MIRHIFALVAILGFTCFATASARADTVVYYSAPETAWSWCTASTGQALRDCAVQYCKDYGGTQCAEIATCEGRWSAIATGAGEVRGIGVACGLKDEETARLWAREICTVKANSFCWIATTFDSDGNQADFDRLRAIDMAHWVSEMLSYANFETGDDSEGMSAETTDSVREFQTMLGMRPTGEVDDALFFLLYDAAGGNQRIIDDVATDHARHVRLEGRGVTLYGDSTAPSAAMTFAEEIGTWDDLRRREGLAVLIATENRNRGGDDFRCSFPAQQAQPLGNSSNGNWRVTCAEATYDVAVTQEGVDLRVSGAAPVGTQPKTKTKTKTQ